MEHQTLVTFVVVHVTMIASIHKTGIKPNHDYIYES